MTKAKPFDIPKREVWEAFKKVKANQGAAGVDGQSIADFEVDLANNLYKLWNRLSSGSYFPQPVRRVDIPKASGRDAAVGHSNGGGPRSRKRLSAGIWSPAWTLCSMRTLTATDPAARRSRPCARRVSAAGDTTGCSTSTSRRSSTRFHTSCFSRHCGHIPDAAWVLLYVERWLKAPVQREDGCIEPRDAGTPQGSVVKSDPGQSVPALRVRHVDDAGPSGRSVRTVCG